MQKVHGPEVKVACMQYPGRRAVISSRRASYIRTSLSGQIWRLLASTKLIISIRLSQRQMELQPGCDPGAGTGCTGLIARVHRYTLKLYPALADYHEVPCSGGSRGSGSGGGNGSGSGRGVVHFKLRPRQLDGSQTTVCPSSQPESLIYRGDLLVGWTAVTIRSNVR